MASPQTWQPLQFRRSQQYGPALPYHTHSIASALRQKISLSMRRHGDLIVVVVQRSVSFSAVLGHDIIKEEEEEAICTKVPPSAFETKRKQVLRFVAASQNRLSQQISSGVLGPQGVLKAGSKAALEGILV